MPVSFSKYTKSRNEKFIFVSVESELSSEVRFLDADRPDGELTLIRPRENDLLYYVENHGDRFFIVTNENAKNFKDNRDSCRFTGQGTLEGLPSL